MVLFAPAVTKLQLKITIHRTTLHILRNLKKVYAAVDLMVLTRCHVEEGLFKKLSLSVGDVHGI